MPVKETTTYPRVLHIASGDLWAGAEVQLFTLIKTLQNKLNVPVSVVLLNHGELETQLQNIGTKTIIIDESRLNWLQIMQLLVRNIRELSPDVIHTHRRKENILGSIASLLVNNTPCIRTAHGNPPRPQIWNFSRWIIRQCDLLTGRFLQKCIISVSEDLAVILSKYLPEKNIRVIDNGLDYDAIYSRFIKRDRTSENSRNSFKIGIACRLVPVKRVDLFIQTAQYMQDHYPNLNTRFHIFGDGHLRDELEKLSHQLNISNVVRFEGHCVDIHDNIQRLDALLITSDHEGLPMILLEAMALHVPVIAHDIGGIPKVLDKGSCGILVQDHSAAGYGKAICKLASSPKTISTLTENAAVRVQENYSAEKNARSYLSLYSELMG